LEGVSTTNCEGEEGEKERLESPPDMTERRRGGRRKRGCKV
jgi:hypothetical protein